MRVHWNPMNPHWISRAHENFGMIFNSVCPERQIPQRLSKRVITVHFLQSSSHAGLMLITFCFKFCELYQSDIGFLSTIHTRRQTGAELLKFDSEFSLSLDMNLQCYSPEMNLLFFYPLHPRKLWPHLFNYQHGKVHYHWLCCWRCLIFFPPLLLSSSSPSSSFVKSRWIYNAAIPSVVNHFSRPRPRDQNEHFDEL